MNPHFKQYEIPQANIITFSHSEVLFTDSNASTEGWHGYDPSGRDTQATPPNPRLIPDEDEYDEYA